MELLNVSPLVLLCFCIGIQTSTADCNIEGVSDREWDNQLELNISDLDTGVIFRGGVTDIQSIYSDSIRDGCKLSKKYVLYQLVNNEFSLILSDDFNQEYEAAEVLTQMRFSIVFVCRMGGRRKLTVFVNVKDTNNHAPEYLPRKDYTYEIDLPLPRNFPISRLYGEIHVKDIDLTTSTIEAQIQNNPLFDLTFDRNVTRKVFKLLLTTKAAINELPQELTYIIVAKDSDTTGYPQLSTFGTVTIRAKQNASQLEFEEKHYTANYDTTKNKLTFAQEIVLKRGYDAATEFSLSEYGFEHFEINNYGPRVAISPKGAIVSDDETLTLTLTAANAKVPQKASTKIEIKFVSAR